MHRRANSVTRNQHARVWILKKQYTKMHLSIVSQNEKVEFMGICGDSPLSLTSWQTISYFILLVFGLKLLNFQVQSQHERQSIEFTFSVYKHWNTLTLWRTFVPCQHFIGDLRFLYVSLGRETVTKAETMGWNV